MKKDILFGFYTVLALLAVSCTTAEKPGVFPDTRPALLRQLDGSWKMQGSIMGDSIEYSLEVKPVLHSTFSELHMKDISVPSEYEARVFIGTDSTGKKVIAHWMDSFGAMYSVPHGTGVIEGNLIDIVFPYTESRFHDQFSFNESTQNWRLLIRSEKDSLLFETFADYTISRSSK